MKRKVRHEICPLCWADGYVQITDNKTIATMIPPFEGGGFLYVYVIPCNKKIHRVIGNVRASTMRCPLCYGQNKIVQDLYTAYVLVFSATGLLEYSKVARFRKEFNKGNR